jgi:transposase
VADALETRFTDDASLTLFPTHGQPACPPWRVALVTIRPFAEGLCDRPAAHAVRRRMDCTYVLRLELTEPGCEASGLSELRGQLSAGAVESPLLHT